MLFKPEMIEQILNGTKCQTRRLVKEKERLSLFESGTVVQGYGQRIKWQVGKKYAVCPGRGKSQVWYCPKCKTCYPVKGIVDDHRYCLVCQQYLKSLFIELTGIRKELLLDISEKDAEREGFDCSWDFLCKFSEINKNKTIGLNHYNPDVWVLEFKVV